MGVRWTFSSVADSGFYELCAGDVAVDAAGNMVFTDPTHGLRVFFVSGAGTAGAAMQAAITLNNPTITELRNLGFIYIAVGLYGGDVCQLPHLA